MLKRFIYKKADNSTSGRVVYPMGIVDDKLFAVDLSEYDNDDRDQLEILLDQVHKEYIESIKELGLGTNFRYFFFKGIQDVSTE